ncbi:MAG: MGMT family protein [Lentimonas sp.]
MASINDNLFTMMTNSTVSKDGSSRLLAHCGPVSIHFSEKGLKQLYFDDKLWRNNKPNYKFREAFIDWMAYYQSLTPATRWKYFALEGTPFQLSVWKALNEIPLGKTVSYQYIAEKIDRPKATRAVGTAVGANPISILIPCHRVIQASGAIGNYRWGADRKLALLDAEQEAGSDLLRLFT